MLLVFGAVVALAQNTSEKTKDAENHECTPEMMKDMSGKCPEHMMQSGACENMMKGSKGGSEMMGGKNLTSASESKETGRCGSNSGMGSMMSSKRMKMKNMKHGTQNPQSRIDENKKEELT